MQTLFGDGERLVHQPRHSDRAEQVAAVRELGERERTRRDRAGHADRAARRWCSPSSMHRAPRSSTCRPSRTFWFTSSRGKRIHSFAGAAAGLRCRRRSIRCSSMIHGGPHGMWRDQFFVRWNYHLLAAPGYVLLLTNYSGSTGFGEEFARVHPGRSAQGSGRRDQRGGGRRHQAVRVHRRQPRNAPVAPATAATSRTGCRRTTTRYKCLISHAGPGEPRGAMGYQRHYLLARGEPGRPAVGTGRGVARAEPDPLTPRSSARRCW
mgnify:CR=1 FL=1